MQTAIADIACITEGGGKAKLLALRTNCLLYTSMWWSRGIGGKSALDYLIKVRGMDFVGAVQTIMGNGSVSFPTCENIKSYEEQPLLLPEKKPTTNVVFDYLFGRGIDYEIINYCLEPVSYTHLRAFPQKRTPTS